MILLNNDAVPEPGFVRPSCGSDAADPRVAAMAATVLLGTGSERPVRTPSAAAVVRAGRDVGRGPVGAAGW